MTTTTRDPADIERELGQIASRSRALFSQHRTYEQMPQSAKDEVKGLAARDHALQEELASIPVTRNPWALKQPIAAGGGGGFAASIIDQGFDLKTRNKVEIPGTALVQKANTFPAVNTWNVTAPNLIGLGQDSRWLFPNLPTQDASNLSAISDFKQTVRTLTGNPIRNLDASTVKANVDVTLTSVVEPLRQIAVTINDIPAALFDSVPTMQAFLEAEARFQVFTALDSHVLAQIVAATPAFGNNGTPSMIAMLRNAITSMRAAGADPDLAVLNPADAAALDLATTGGDAQYVFALRDTGDSSPLWGLEIIERIGGGTDPPYVIDRDMLGVLYLGDLSVQADPYSGFKSNLVTLRVEVNALFHVRNIQGARRVAAT